MSDKEGVSVNPVGEEPEVDVYAYLLDMLDQGLKTSKGVDYSEEGYGFLKYYFLVGKEYLRANLGNIIVFLLYAYFGFEFLMGCYGLIMAVVDVNPNYLPSSVYPYLWRGLTPFVVWVFSTLYDHWNYHDRKKRMIAFCCINFSLQLVRIGFLILYGILTPLFLMIPINRDISTGMVFSLARIVFLVLTALLFAVLVNAFLTNLKSPFTAQEIIKFKFGKHLDLRKNKKWEYDLNVVARLDDGRRYVIKMKDRFLHALANGVTGSGKTSTLMTVGISNDIDQSIRNREYQKKIVMEWLKKKRVTMIQPFKDEDFSLEYFKGVDAIAEKRLKKLKSAAPVAGISAMAPNASFADEIYSIAKAKGRKVNRLDPVVGDDGYLKEGYRGFNPLYISPEINPKDTPHKFVLEVANTAINTANVLQSVYDISGSTDVYFASLNRNITTTLIMLLLLTYPAMNDGKQPTLLAFQAIINNFEKAKPYRNKLVQLYGKKNELGEPIMDRGKADVGPFQMVLDVVDSEILGPGAEKMSDQARGLRIVINTFLTNPSIRNILCCEDTIDLDHALAQGEVTVVNYALEYDSAGIAFGLFYLLSFISAVERRPGNERTRVPHFFYVDELPVLVHPKVEHCITLFRQYRVATFAAVQSLAQMEKNPSTSFLRNTFVGNCAHHFVFGRAALEEMELYEKLAGRQLVTTEMKGRTENSITEENPQVSFNTREQISRDNRIFGDEIRNRDFQEVTVVTVDQGSPVDIFFGKTAFLPKYKRYGRRRKARNWKEYYRADAVEQREEQKEEQKESVIDSFKTVTAEVTDRTRPTNFRLSSGMNALPVDAGNDGKPEKDPGVLPTEPESASGSSGQGRQVPEAVGKGEKTKDDVFRMNFGQEE